MSTTWRCPAGHDSLAGDYCDTCGAPIEASPDPVSPDPVSPDPGPDSGVTRAPAAVGVAGTCPNCDAAYDGTTVFCEDCGYDFATASMPATPTPTATPVAPPTPTATPATTPLLPAGATSSSPARALIVVSVDQGHYDRVGDSTVPIPVATPDRTVEVVADEVRIGRKSTRRNIYPDVDLSVAPEDVAVSREHARITMAADDTTTVEDLGSANGTYLNDGPDPIAPNIAVPLKNGDRIYVGAWTRLTLVVL